MQPELLLIGVVVVTILVALAGFSVGERRRRRAAGQAGPRPARSIGEALRAAKPRRARVLVLFLDDDDAGLEAASAVAEDPEILGLLARADMVHCLIRSAAKEGREVAQTLFQKYAKQDLPPVPAVALLLDADGLPIAVGSQQDPLSTWLVEWVKKQPRQGVASGGEEAPPESPAGPAR